jgi:thiamine biosynthesis lipoprotein
VVLVSEPRDLTAAAARVRTLIDEIDHSCSRFRADSELCRLNAAGGTPVRVSRLFVRATRCALRAARLTDGDLDPTIGSSLRVAGYDRDFAAIRAGAPVRFRRAGGWRSVELDDAHCTVRLPAGVELDYGATAKALAADIAAAAVAEEIGGGVLVSLGGDIAIAGPAPDGGWPVRVTDDHAADADAPGETIALHDGGLATSSTTLRRWRRGDGELHHILDPASGRPARECWRTVSVAAASCVDANIASTTAILRAERAPQWLDGLGLPSRLVALDGSVTLAGGWPVDEPAPR